jgi:class 3 adenylate cyclase
MGGADAGPDDRVRETELPVIESGELLLRLGVRPATIARSLRIYGESLRRMAETEADWWGSEILAPMVEAGVPPAEIGRRTAAFSTEMTRSGDVALLAMYHAHQSIAWVRNIFESFEAVLTSQGLQARVERPPAIAFLDISGYTRLTEERGDEAARDLAESLGRIVHRSSTQHGGRTVKWLGDGVMFHFPEPARSVVACLEMAAAVTREGLPPAHVGINAGPVLTQGGDFFGRTVNAAARIAEYARQDEVLVTHDVVQASSALGDSVVFHAIGPVELKGLSGTLDLYRAVRTTDRVDTVSGRSSGRCPDGPPGLRWHHGPWSREVRDAGVRPVHRNRGRTLGSDCRVRPTTPGAGDPDPGGRRQG